METKINKNPSFFGFRILVNKPSIVLGQAQRHNGLMEENKERGMEKKRGRKGRCFSSKPCRGDG